MRELQYLNMTLNNVKKIEGLEQNEALEKLDMTCNFVKDPLCLESLKARGPAQTLTAALRRSDGVAPQR